MTRYTVRENNLVLDLLFDYYGPAPSWNAGPPIAMRDGWAADLAKSEGEERHTYAGWHRKVTDALSCLPVPTAMSRNGRPAGSTRIVTAGAKGRTEEGPSTQALVMARLALPSATAALPGSFQPKSATGYSASIPASVQIKSRDHEALVNDYGSWSIGQGFTPDTPHPRDLTLTRAGVTWLVEAKMIDGCPTANQATRAAIGQLFDYAYQDNAKPSLLALFSGPIPAREVGLLASLGIAAVWRTGSGWDGSPAAVAAGLTGV